MNNIKYLLEKLELFEASYGIVNEGYIFNSKDLEINLDKWNNIKGNNILFITGLSGSGKTTLSKQYAEKYNVKLFSFDDIESGDDPYNTGVIKYLKSKFSIYKKFLNNPELYQEELKEREYNLLVKASIDYLYTKKERIIVEGIDVYYLHSNGYYDLSGKPMVIKGTSVLWSIIRRFKRNANGGKIDWNKELHNEFLELVCWYLDDEKMLRKTKKRF